MHHRGFNRRYRPVFSGYWRVTPWSFSLPVALSVALLLITVAPALAAFTPDGNLTVGTGPQAVVIGDINGDGKQDLVTANRAAFPPSISVALNTTTTAGGSPSFAAKVDFEVETYPFHVALGDLNADGKPDVVTANAGGGSGTTVSVFLNTTPALGSTPTFATRVDFTVGEQPSSVVIGDLDEDGKPDLAVANTDQPAGTTVSVLLNSTPVLGGTPSFAAKVDFTVGQGPYSIAIGDLDGDGKRDLVTANWAQGGGTTVSILRNTTTTIGAPTFAAKLDLTVGTGPIPVAIGDLNGDGKPEIVAGNFGFGAQFTVSVLQNTTTTVGSPTFATKVDFTVGAGPQFVVIGDLNGDGKPEIATANFTAQTFSVLPNTTATVGGAPTFAIHSPLATVGLPSAVAIGDLNGDGKPDAAVSIFGDSTATTVTVFRAVASGNLQFGTATSSIDETGGTVSIPVTRTGSADGQVSAIVSVTGGTATQGQDFTFPAPQTLTWPDGDGTILFVNVPILTDQVADDSEQISLTVSLPANPFGAKVGIQPSHTVTITDTTVPVFSIADVTVAEGATGTTQANLVVTMNPPSSSGTFVNYTTANGTAIAGQDFQAVTSGILFFNPLETSKTAAVPIFGDTTIEPDETFTVTLAGPSGGTSIGRATATATIANDDSACTPRPRVVTTPAVGGGALQVQVASTPLNSQAPNPISQIRFGAFQNARVTLNGQTITSGQTVTLPANTTTVNFAVARATAGQATTVPFTVVDGCGEFPTFVGGGAGAGF